MLSHNQFMYSPSQYMYMVAALLFCVIDCTFVLRYYFFGTRTVVQLQRCQKMTSKEYGKIGHVDPQKLITSPQQNKAQNNPVYILWYVV